MPSGFRTPAVCRRFFSVTNKVQGFLPWSFLHQFSLHPPREEEISQTQTIPIATGNHKETRHPWRAWRYPALASRDRCLPMRSVPASVHLQDCKRSAFAHNANAAKTYGTEEMDYFLSARASLPTNYWCYGPFPPPLPRLPVSTA